MKRGSLDREDFSAVGPVRGLDRGGLFELLGNEPGVIELDETPAGDFLELEGPPEWIDATAAA